MPGQPNYWVRERLNGDKRLHNRHLGCSWWYRNYVSNSNTCYSSLTCGNKHTLTQKVFTTHIHTLHRRTLISAATKRGESIFASAKMPNINDLNCKNTCFVNVTEFIWPSHTWLVQFLGKPVGTCLFKYFWQLLQQIKVYRSEYSKTHFYLGYVLFLTIVKSYNNN